MQYCRALSCLDTKRRGNSLHAITAYASRAVVQKLPPGRRKAQWASKPTHNSKCPSHSPNKDQREEGRARAGVLSVPRHRRVPSFHYCGQLPAASCAADVLNVFAQRSAPFDGFISEAFRDIAYGEAITGNNSRIL